MAVKYAAFGTLLQRSIDGVAAYTTIAGVRDIPGPGAVIDTVDVTAHDSVGGFEEVIPTIKRSEAMAIELVFDPADTGHIALKADYDSKTKRFFKVVEPNTGTAEWAFAGYVLGFVPSHAYDGALTATVTLKPTGNITLTQ